MDNVKSNYETVKLIVERVQWFYDCAKSLRTGVKEIGFVENPLDKENLNKEEEQYENYYKAYQASVDGYPDLNVFLECMWDQLGLDSLVKLARCAEWQIAERLMDQLHYTEMKRHFADSNWSVPENVLEKVQHQLEKNETSLEQLVKKEKEKSDYWLSVLRFDSSKCYVGELKTKADKKEKVYDIPGKAEDEPNVDVNNQIYTPLKSLLKEIDSKDDAEEERLLNLFTTGPSQKDHLYLNVFGEEAYCALKAYFLWNQPEEGAYDDIIAAEPVAEALQKLDEPNDKDVRIFMGKIARLKKIWFQNIYKKDIRTDMNGYDFAETILILQSLLPLIDQEGKPKSLKRYRREKKLIFDRVKAYEEEKKKSQTVRIPIHGFSDFAYQECTAEMQKTIKQLKKHKGALEALQKCLAGWENRNAQRLKDFVRVYAERIDERRELPTDSEGWFELVVDCLDTEMRGELGRSFIFRNR